MRLTLFGTLTILAALAPLSKADLLVNGGFESTNNGHSETQTPVGWTNVGHIDGVIAYSVFGTPAYDGSYYYDLGGYGGALPGNGDGIEQTVATTVGTQYTLQFGYSNENVAGYGPEDLNVLIDGVLQQSYLMVYNSAYGGFQDPFVTTTLNYTATSTSSTILFTVTGTNLGGQDPLIDGASFAASSSSPVPEPGSISLLVTVVIALGLVEMRRRQRSSHA